MSTISSNFGAAFNNFKDTSPKPIVQSTGIDSGANAKLYADVKKYFALDPAQATKDAKFIADSKKISADNPSKSDEEAQKVIAFIDKQLNDFANNSTWRNIVTTVETGYMTTTGLVDALVVPMDAAVQEIKQLITTFDDSLFQSANHELDMMTARLRTNLPHIGQYGLGALPLDLTSMLQYFCGDISLLLPVSATKFLQDADKFLHSEEELLKDQYNSIKKAYIKAVIDPIKALVEIIMGPINSLIDIAVRDYTALVKASGIAHFMDILAIIEKCLTKKNMFFNRPLNHFYYQNTTIFKSVYYRNALCLDANGGVSLAAFFKGEMNKYQQLFNLLYKSMNMFNILEGG